MLTTDQQLPPEDMEEGGEVVSAVQVVLDPEEEQRKREEMLKMLDDVVASLVASRQEAIRAREASGIENEWLEDEEHYAGIDDANRAEHHGTWRRKPMGQASTPPKTGEVRSTVFPNITRPYVDAASARIADMLLPTDDRSWSIKPTPNPALSELIKGKAPKALLLKAANENPGNPEGAKKALHEAVDQAMQEMEQANSLAERAQQQIEDWHVECQWHAQIRQVIEDAARIGTGVLKGPVPVLKRSTVFRDGQLVVEEKLQPESRALDPWNVYPDPACGENIHNGSHLWERDYLTVRSLRELKKDPNYLADQIDKCIEEGPKRAVANPKENPEGLVQGEEKRYEIWYMHGFLEREQLELLGCDCTGEKDPNLPAIITMVNDRCIKAVLSPFDSGELPYDVMVWQRRKGHWTGVGVARQIRTPQRIVVAGSRAMMDNAGLASGPMLVFKQGVVTGADGNNVIRPRKVWYIAEDADEMADATKAIGVVKVDMLVSELMVIIQLGLKLAEDVTGLPMLLQGQQAGAPDTLGGMQMLNNNASAVLRRLARLFDDYITEPHIRRYYAYAMLYGPDDIKGDLQVDARGSSALVERDLQNQYIQQMGAMALDPRFGIDPKLWMEENLKSQRLDPARFRFKDEQWQKIVENMAQGPQDPRLAIAQLSAEVNERLEAMRLGVEQQERDKDRRLELVIEQMRREGKESISLSALKGLLAKTTLTLTAQERMSRRAQGAKQVATPPTEPAGRAERGRAYEQ